MKFRTRLIWPLLAISSLCVPALSSAQDAYPSKPIHIINPYAPGGVIDVLARALSDRLGASLPTPFVIESRSGGAGNIGTDYVAQMPGDGYTWLIATTSNAANMALMPNIRTDLLNAFTPVAQFAYSPNYFVVPASLPVSTVHEYVALAKSKPGALNYGSGGIGSTPHLGFELFKHVAGIDVMAVHYKGAPPIIPDLASGRLSATYMPASLAIGKAKSDRVKVIATVSDVHTKDFPDVPTMAEAGYGKAVVAPWFAVLVPKSTPPAIVKRIESAVRTAVASPELAQQFASAGAVPRFGDSAATTRMISDEIQSWRALVKATGIKAE